MPSELHYRSNCSPLSVKEIDVRAGVENISSNDLFRSKILQNSRECLRLNPTSNPEQFVEAQGPLQEVSVTIRHTCSLFFGLASPLRQVT